jgi:hypothetical protein
MQNTLPSNGAILDASALIDFHWIGHWEWLEARHGPLYVSSELLASDALDLPTRASATRELVPRTLESGEQLGTFAALLAAEPGLSAADAATVALAHHLPLACITDDQVMVRVCRTRGVVVHRTLALLSEMVIGGYLTKQQAIAEADFLVNERGKWIAPRILGAWKASLR